MDFKFELGQTVKDTITGYEGIVVSRSQWISNCNTYGVKSQTLKDGKPIETEHFDEPVLVLIEEKQVMEPAQKTGGPVERIRNTNR